MNTPTQKQIEDVAEAMSDYLTQLGINPDERPEHGGRSIAEVLAAVALKSALANASDQATAK
jgi:hypothetical protein